MPSPPAGGYGDGACLPAEPFMLPMPGGRWVLACWDQATLPGQYDPNQYATTFRSRLRVMYLEAS